MWFYIGAPLAMVGKYGVASLLRYMGAMYNNPGLITAGEWFYSAWGQLALGTVLLALFTWLFIIGTKKYMTLQNILFAIATVGLFVVMVVMLTTNADRFEAAFNDYVLRLGGEANAYDQVIELAANDPDFPLEVPETTDWQQTFYSTIWGFYIMAFAFYAAYLGGEIKSAKRTNLISMPLSIVYVTLFTCVVIWVFLRVPGINFLASLYYFDPDVGNTTSELLEPVLGMRDYVPHFVELASVVAAPVIGIFMGIAFLFWTYAWMPISLVSSTRPVMAWSFDRLFPRAFSDVHPKYRTPVNAILLGAVVGWISLALFAFEVYGLLSGTAGDFLVLGSSIPLMACWQIQEACGLR
jgi:amino acid transporter